MTLGQLTSPFLIDTNDEHLLSQLMFIHMVIAAVFFVVTCMYVKDAPASVPPAPSLQNSDSEAVEASFTQEVKIVLRNKHFLFLICTLLFSQAINNSFSNLVGELANYLDFNNSVAG